MANMERNRWWASRTKDSNLGVGDLQDRTNRYWNQDRRDEKERLKRYVDMLLPYELHFAQRGGALEWPPCDTLALLVGHSLEPLFQAIGVFEPQRVVLLLNKVYGCREVGKWQSGKHRGADVKQWIEELLIPLLGKSRDEVVIESKVIGRPGEKADLPDAVFHALCAHVLSDRQEGDKVIVDITGAKKSMDVGAFLFAAYANIPVSYVDFGCYHPDKRRPYGYTCRIGLLPNPYETFELRRWEEVQHLYERYHFRAAREALEQILPAMRSPLTGAGRSLFDTSQIHAAERLQRVLQFYEAWNDGDYCRANDLLSDLEPLLLGEFIPPSAVESLAELWAAISVTSSIRQLRDSLAQMELDTQLLMSNNLLLTYARDELAKIKRLVEENEDNRSALLRAAGLDELLLKARWVRLWNAGNTGWIDLWIREREKRNDERLRECRSSPSISYPASPEDLYNKLVHHSGDTRYMRQALQSSKKARRSGKTVFIPLKMETRYRARPAPDAPQLEHYEQNIRPSAEVLTDLRNQAIHKYQYVTWPIAQAALELAEANLKDFENEKKGWMCLASDAMEGTDLGRLSWDEICVACGLDFLPFHVAKQGENS